MYRVLRLPLISLSLAPIQGLVLVTSVLTEVLGVVCLLTLHTERSSLKHRPMTILVMSIRVLLPRVSLVAFAIAAFPGTWLVINLKTASATSRARNRAFPRLSAAIIPFCGIGGGRRPRRHVVEPCQECLFSQCFKRLES